MEEWIKTGIPGFDDLLEKGIPKGISILIAGGPGSGKTIFGLQTLNHAASNGEKCLFMSFEEPPQRLRDHMADFGWDAEKLEEEGNLMIKRYNTFEVSRAVEALLEKEEKELLIEAPPVFIPKGFKPELIVVDSLSAIAAPFAKEEENYRVYIDQLLRYFEKLDATSFLITESVQTPDHTRRLTSSGVEEFLVDGVIVLYNIRKGDMRVNALETLKMRGAKFQKKIVPMEIVSGKGLVVYPTEGIFGV
ncbi:MAG: RAD55 family ATPase [Candidatus Hydrothermarchaeaceae archaeon]